MVEHGATFSGSRNLLIHLSKRRLMLSCSCVPLQILTSVPPTTAGVRTRASTRGVRTRADVASDSNSPGTSDPAPVRPAQITQHWLSVTIWLSVPPIWQQRYRTRKKYRAKSTKCLLECTADIDECATGAATCSQGCVNQAPGYRCICNSGYVLQSNNSCAGETPSLSLGCLKKFGGQLQHMQVLYISTCR